MTTPCHCEKPFYKFRGQAILPSSHVIASRRRSNLLHSNVISMIKRTGHGRSFVIRSKKTVSQLGSPCPYPFEPEQLLGP
jgi:hypothetical protein